MLTELGLKGDIGADGAKALSDSLLEGNVRGRVLPDTSTWCRDKCRLNLPSHRLS
jgi:hypothetical protein